MSSLVTCPAALSRRTLTALHVSGNRIGAEGRHALCAVLAKTGCALKKLEVGTIGEGQLIGTRFTPVRVVGVS